MKKIFVVLCLVLLASCEAGKFPSQRERLHNMGRENICQTNPGRCIDGTDIAW